MKKFTLLVIILAISYFELNAAELAPMYYKNLRGMSMGNSYVASADDESILIYNPALLGTVNEGHVTFFKVTGGISSDGFKVLDTINTIASDEGTDAFKAKTDAQKMEYYQSKQKDVNNKLLNSMVSMDLISYVGNNVGYGLLGAGDIKMAILNPVNPKVMGNVIAEASLPFAVSMSLGNFKLGGQIRGIYQINSINTKYLTSTSTDDLINQEVRTGFAVTLGGLYEINEDIKVGVSLQDLVSSISVETGMTETINGKSELKMKSAGTHTLPINLRIGGSYKLSSLKWLVLSSELENVLSNDINGDGKKDTSFFNKIHVGAEAKLVENNSFAFKVRTGINQGYITFGFMAKFWMFDAEYANYTEEIGPNAGMKDNNINALSLGMRF